MDQESRRAVSRAIISSSLVGTAIVFGPAALREALGVTIAALTLFAGMKRFDVTWWGKTATFLLMFAFPGFMLGASTFPGHQGFEIASWLLGIPGLILSYYTAVTYIPTIRASLREGRGSAR